MTDKPYRVAIWCAVSSPAQAAEDKVSLEAQERAGRDFAEAINGIVARVYTVPGHTRDIIFWHEAEREMPAYRELREDVEAGRFDVLHAVDPDRLGRDPALSNQLVSLVEKSGAEVYLASSPHVIGQKGTGARYVFAIQSTRAGEDQRRRVVYHRRGMTARIRRGLHSSQWPYGYRPIRAGNTTIGAEFDDNIEAVRIATARFLAGDSYNRIAARLDESPYRPQHSDRWEHGTIRYMMLRDTYAGRVRWGEVVARSDRFPALWDEDTYAAILRERERRAGGSKKMLFGRVAFCARCGEPMYRIGRDRDGRAMVACSSHRADRALCHANTVYVEKLMDALQAHIDLLYDDEAIEAQLSESTDITAQLKSQVNDITHRIADVEQRRQRLAHTLAGGLIDPEMYRSTDDDLLSERGRWEAERRLVQAEIDAQPDRTQQVAALSRLYAQRDRLFEMPEPQANTMLREAGIRIECEDRQVVEIHC